MALKSVVFGFLLVAVMAAARTEAQSGGFYGLIRIEGTVFCSLRGNTGFNGAPAPPFQNAAVKLMCGGANLISSGITDRNGIFSMVLDPNQYAINTILNQCYLEVDTPLSTCNPKMPMKGTLQSPIQLSGNSYVGYWNVIYLMPAGFQYVAAA